MSLRRLQWKSATGGNIVMQIFLGKQYLGQSDRQAFEHSGAEGKPPIRYIQVEASGGNVLANKEITGKRA